ncbi:MAG: Gfo/Idh/MocA family oxidoreductase [Chloroflexi bacterium]|nr:Gfo/Idh/MocA family oxidoreductase [Chloroflexota bacterium]
MPIKKLRWGLLSTAKINRALIPPIRASARGELAAVASRDRAKADAYAKEWNIPKAYSSYEALLADDDIDIVYISLPNSLHAEWAVKCAEAGKHVLVEKPFALTTAEVDRMTEATKRTGKVMAEAFMYRHHSQTLKVKELIESGAIGDVSLVKASFTFNLTRAVDVRLDPALGGGSVWDVGCYPISLAQYVFDGPPVEVVGWQKQDSTGVDGWFVGQLRYSGDRFAQFDCGFRSPFRTHAEIVGRAGAIMLTQPFKPDATAKLILRRNDADEVVPVAERQLYEGEVEDLHDAILNGKPPRVSLAESRGHVATLVALYESAKTGKPVRVA